MTTLAENLTKRRKRLNMTPEQAAKLVGACRATWYAWEAGTTVPTVPSLVQIASKLQTTAAKLLQGVALVLALLCPAVASGAHPTHYARPVYRSPQSLGYAIPWAAYPMVPFPVWIGPYPYARAYSVPYGNKFEEQRIRRAARDEVRRELKAARGY